MTPPPYWSVDIPPPPDFSIDGEKPAADAGPDSPLAELANPSARAGRLRLKRALLSVSDKTGLLGLAETLHRFNVELISTGGTASYLRDAGFEVTDISQLTGHSEWFAGRVKTLSAEVAGALLFDRIHHAEEARAHGIAPIDLVVCNLYPFREAWQAGRPHPALVEEIDIGGVTLIRAGAKNAAWVAVVVDPCEYEAVARELSETGGYVSLATRQRLQRLAFRYTADYDALIATAFDEMAGEPSHRLTFVDGRRLRYGENPHQQALVYRSAEAPWPYALKQGKDLSYTNLLDLHAAVTAVQSLPGCGCAVVKHANPCGLAVGPTPAAAFDLAWNGDPVSAFGSTVAFNEVVTAETVDRFGLDAPDRASRKFIEIVVAPAFAPEALTRLAVAPNLRVVEWQGPARQGWIDRVVGPLLLRQEADLPTAEPLVTCTTLPFPEEAADLARFGCIAAALAASNAVVIVRAAPGGGFQLLGLGGGQPNRVAATRLAIEVATANLHREAAARGADPTAWCRDQMAQAVLVSDAFFPFPDSIEEAARAGLRRIVQPGGSRRDQEVIDRANALGLAMAFTGRRHFRH
ncbi:MAG: bifunctional phosphoribosylaminoimidazolecarboxamide formyltransferase/IMP cyclohydrolase PurH [Candidatus Ozemobacter sibiricus]|jgi:phosphoribosylaminoimidazolecarboxamide formyltransferase/IMP cyclohydrolase|uniref:Bifunctional phosphoribosylaminoimidazolecarboxamide formyltransferase/IMP cyclohydrolase PurH n=1 Tax=Candidatus Ozemobacter sibiricus TaxID=2268124 RepID=A0A367ZJ10_9BACT|nr:MAG: bifunctional phosphoribosylaminoimidazolecarboxamide formyltransferase/IMP cyclohydrolase PurH [Candidatus Ozemobacter sibiricus]